MDDERFTALYGRVMAIGTMAEVVTFAFLADKPDTMRAILLATLRSAARDIGQAGTMSDETAVFMSDARVHAEQALAMMAGRVEAMLLQAQA